MAMAQRPNPPRLGAGELEIVEMLWRAGEVTLSEAQRAMDRPVGYTTVQTRLNRLVAKGVVARGKGRPARYRAIVRPDEVSARYMDLLLERVSGGSVVPLVAHLMKRKRLSPDEIAQLKRLIVESEQANRSDRTNRGGPKP
jgi:BlaI family transcriptional regulator, penicillinase repressor